MKKRQEKRTLLEREAAAYDVWVCEWFQALALDALTRRFHADLEDDVAPTSEALRKIFWDMAEAYRVCNLRHQEEEANFRRMRRVWKMVEEVALNALNVVHAHASLTLLAHARVL